MPENGYLKSRIRSIAYALDGLRYVLVSQQNARIHAGFTLAVFLSGFLFKISRVEWSVLLLTVGMVWMAEIFNSAIELIIDVVYPENNPTAKICKDVSAGSVLITVFVSIVVGILIFGPPLWRWGLTVASSIIP